MGIKSIDMNWINGKWELWVNCIVYPITVYENYSLELRETNVTKCMSGLYVHTNWLGTLLTVSYIQVTIVTFTVGYIPPYNLYTS